MDWKDVTSYAQGQKDRTPTAWAAKVSGLRISIVCNHIHNRGRWVLTCEPWFDVHDMGMSADVPTEIAQAEAARLLRNKLIQALAALAEGEGE